MLVYSFPPPIMETLSGGKLLHPAAMMAGDERTVHSDVTIQCQDLGPMVIRCGEIVKFVKREEGPRPGQWLIRYNGLHATVDYDELRKIVVEE